MAHTRTFSHDEAVPDPRAAEGTAQEADRLQEDEVGLLALECTSETRYEFGHCTDFS